jgi:hypothetical protein
MKNRALYNLKNLGVNGGGGIKLNGSEKSRV